MGTKQNPGTFDCHAKALPDEPMFILLARDPSAPELVREWADERARQIDQGDRPPSDIQMVDEARECALEMESWRDGNNGKWREPQAQDEAAAQYAVVEIFGHRSHSGRVEEVERFGAKFLRIDQFYEDGTVFATHFYPGSSIFSFTPCTKEYATTKAYRRRDPVLAAPAVEVDKDGEAFDPDEDQP